MNLCSPFPTPCSLTKPCPLPLVKTLLSLGVSFQVYLEDSVIFRSHLCSHITGPFWTHASKSGLGVHIQDPLMQLVNSYTAVCKSLRFSPAEPALESGKTLLWAPLMKGSCVSRQEAGHGAALLHPGDASTHESWLIINQGHSHVHCSQSKLVAWGRDTMILLENSAGRGTGCTSTAAAPPHNDAASINRPPGVGYKCSAPIHETAIAGQWGRTSVRWLHALYNDLTEQQKVRHATSGSELLSHKHSTECSQL